ncbi:MAG TPA: histidinol-phosphatase HisJ family protein [Candidatus Cloacimonadota bacterium]|nr:histidinol-phosphatase HisJ family protein [Candidatus Cloacimonadota bacterium]HQL14230.1 histidinol-phosphatase HisJ family protein [Candidatus Cloacimonadota bacterium]
MKKDFHLHADFSPDSSIKLAELVPRAAELGYSELAITEHLDLMPQEIAVSGLPSLQKYQKMVAEIQALYPHLKLHCGIEVGDFTEVRSQAIPLLNEFHFRPVLGSIHIILQNLNVAIPLKKKLRPTEIKAYYETNLRMVETCPIDILAHLGVYKRYYSEKPVEMHCQSLISRIFEVMIYRGIALEINYSGLRRPYKSLLPEPEYLALYKKLGGKLVTIGSDAHKLQFFDDFYHIAYQAVTEFGFEILSLN